MNKLYLIFTVVLISVCSAFGQDSVQTVDSVDLNKYSGKWFEIARYPNKFQKDCVGQVTATYTIKEEKAKNKKAKPETKLEVLNECLKENGKTMSAKGEGKIVDDKTNAKLKVRFAPGWLSWVSKTWGDYWILDLEKDYNYAVVGDPDKEYLWILSRTPELDTKTYENILDKIEKQGFNPNKLIKTPQNVETLKGEVITKPQT